MTPAHIRLLHRLAVGAIKPGTSAHVSNCFISTVYIDVALIYWFLSCDFQSNQQLLDTLLCDGYFYR